MKITLVRLISVTNVSGHGFTSLSLITLVYDNFANLIDALDFKHEFKYEY